MDAKVIPTYLFNVLGALLEELQVDSQLMVAGTGISLAVLYNHQTRISFREAMQIYSNAVDLSPNPALGLMMAERMSFSDWGMLGYAIASCRCAEEAIECSNRFHSTTTTVTMFHSGKEHNAYVSYAAPLFPIGRLQSYIIEQAFGGVTNVLRALTSSSGRLLCPKEVHLSYSQPQYVQKYREFFRCPVSFNSSVNKIIWHDEDIHRPFNHYNPTTHKLMVQLCEEFLRETSDNQGLTYDIRCRLLRSSGSFPSIGIMAADLGTSARSLSRSLRALGTSYQKLLDQAREQIATEYLTTSSLRLDEIAALSGFSDTGNFHRAFKRWTGKPPLAFRKGDSAGK